MIPSGNDAFGDGHGFRMPERTLKAPYRYSYDLSKLPTHDRPFLGLYNKPEGATEPMIIMRAKPHRNLRFVSYENHHYMTDPIAWAELPKP